MIVIQRFTAAELSTCAYFDWVPNCHSNPITQRVRRKRQRLPPTLLIENASGLILRGRHNYSAEAFPIKANDDLPTTAAS